MRDVPPVHFEDDDQDSFDDVDALFGHLESFEPPSDMVERIMDAVSKLPLPQYISRTSNDDGTLTVRHDDKQPS